MDTAVDGVETWMPVVGWESFYSVSDSGLVRSERRVTRSGPRGGRVLTPWYSHSGYKMVTLSVPSRHWGVAVHRLVATAFLGEIPTGYEVNHINGIKTDNSLSNLEIVTPEQNRQHASDTGLILRGEAHPLSRVTEADVLAIRELAKTISQTAIAKMYGLHRRSISDIVTGGSWHRLPGARPPVNRRGETNGFAKLTEAQVREIRSRAGVTRQVDLASEFGVTQSAVSSILTGKAWRHVAVAAEASAV